MCPRPLTLSISLSSRFLLEMIRSSPVTERMRVDFRPISAIDPLVWS
jgi:hypothetical protein